MLYQGLDQTVTHGPPEGELPRSWFDPSTMRAAHRQYSAATDINESDFRAVFDLLVEMSGNNISVAYLQSFGDYYAAQGAN